MCFHGVPPGSLVNFSMLMMFKFLYSRVVLGQGADAILHHLALGTSGVLKWSTHDIPSENSHPNIGNSASEFNSLGSKDSREFNQYYT